MSFGPGNIIRGLQHHGVIGTLRRLLYMKEVKVGTLMGVDKYGNHYYENLELQHGLENDLHNKTIRKKY